MQVVAVVARSAPLQRFTRGTDAVRRHSTMAKEKLAKCSEGTFGTGSGPGSRRHAARPTAAHLIDDAYIAALAACRAGKPSPVPTHCTGLSARQTPLQLRQGHYRHPALQHRLARSAAHRPCRRSYICITLRIVGRCSRHAAHRRRRDVWLVTLRGAALQRVQSAKRGLQLLQHALGEAVHAAAPAGQRP